MKTKNIQRVAIMLIIVLSASTILINLSEAQTRYHRHHFVEIPASTSASVPTPTPAPISVSVPIVNTSINTSVNTYTTYDDFEGALYTLDEGSVSPNGKWQDLWNGYGSSGTITDASGNKIFSMYPSTSIDSNATSSALVMSTQTFSNFEFNVSAKTVSQLRQNSPPNPWEVAWIMFRYTDLSHYYYFKSTPTGIELGKQDGTGRQEFLYTANIPTTTIGTWSTWTINVVGNHIVVYVDNVKAIDYIDNTMSSQLQSGSIGLYTEDALVNFDNVNYRVI